MVHFNNNLNLDNTILYSCRPEPDIEWQSEITIKDFQSALDTQHKIGFLNPFVLNLLF